MKIKLCIPDKLGEIVQRSRRRLGVSADEMLGDLGIGAHHLSDIENGRAKHGYNVLIAMIRRLGIDPNLFFYPEREELSEKRQQLIHLAETCSDERVDVMLAIWKGLPEEKKI